MISLGIFIILIVATEAITEIIVASEFPLFESFRNALARRAIPDTPRNDFKQRLIVVIYKLFSCGYCFSVWSAAFFALFAPTLFNNGFVNWLCFMLVLHRISNWIHVVFELVKKGRVGTHDLAVAVSFAITEDEVEIDDDVNDLVQSLEEK